MSTISSSASSSSLSSTYSIREKQIEVLKCMLNFNQPLPTNVKLNEPAWKVLVYDECGQDIISPLLTVKELRDMGVTAHLLLKADRDPIPDVPAIYFVYPSPENVAKLCQDLKNELYESYYLNFITPIPRSLLEDIAQAAIAANCVQQINKVFDQYLNFISLDDELFCLRHQNKEKISYYSINRSAVDVPEMESIVNVIVEGLFSFFVTLGTVPIIRCPKSTDAAFYVAEKLDKKIRDNMRDTRNSLFLNDNMSHLGQLSFQRPLLILLDRNFDLTTPLHHTWTYQALIHDVFDLKLNRVDVDTSTTNQSTASTSAAIANQRKTYDLLNTDKLWKQQKGNPFPVVAESIQSELEKFKQYDGQIKNLKDSIGVDEGNDEGMANVFNNTSKLSSVFSSLPELTEMKRLLDMHTNIATALLDQIKKRKLDNFFEAEEKLMSKATLENSISEMINDPQFGNSEDKLRLFIIYYLCNPNLSQAELDQYLIQLKTANCDIDFIKYLKRYKSLIQTNYSNQYDSGLSNVMKFSNLLSKSSKFVVDGVKNFVVKQNKFPITKITENLMEQKSSPDTDEYRYFDPKMTKPDGNRIRTPINDAIVFVIGGGNYVEYQNLLDNAKAKSINGVSRRVIYGCTEFVTPSHLIKQFTSLGQEIQ